MTRERPNVAPTHGRRRAAGISRTANAEVRPSLAAAEAASADAASAEERARGGLLESASARARDVARRAARVLARAAPSGLRRSDGPQDPDSASAGCGSFRRACRAACSRQGLRPEAARAARPPPQTPSGRLRPEDSSGVSFCDSFRLGQTVPKYYNKICRCLGTHSAGACGPLCDPFGWRGHLFAVKVWIDFALKPQNLQTYSGFSLPS